MSALSPRLRKQLRAAGGLIAAGLLIEAGTLVTSSQRLF